MFKPKIVLFLLGFFACALGYSQHHAETNKQQIFSTSLNQERELWIKLPFNFDPAEAYDVLIVLDAEKYFELTNVLVDNRTRYGKLNPTILVGIPNPNMEERSRNLTFSRSTVDQKGEATSRYTSENSGKAEAFAEFLNEEVLSFLSQEFRVKQFGIIGHSFGGYFALYNSTLEDEISEYILIDPSLWYNNGEALKQIQTHIERLKERNEIHFYLAHEDGIKNNNGKMASLARIFDKHDIAYSNFEYRNENHGSVILPALVDILRDKGKNIQRTPRHKIKK